MKAGKQLCIWMIRDTSGKTLERPGMQSLLREVRSGNVDVVVPCKLDRITHYLHGFYEFWKILNEHKVNFVSATQAFLDE